MSVIFNEPPEESGHSKEAPYLCVVSRRGHFSNSFQVEGTGLHAISGDLMSQERYLLMEETTFRRFQLQSVLMEVLKHGL